MSLRERAKDSAGQAWRLLCRLPLTPVALGVLVLGSGTYIYRSHDAAQADAQQQATLYARLLADHTARSLGAVGLMVGAAGSRLDVILAENGRRDSPAADSLQRTLSDVTAGQPLVRSLSLVREDGLVIASSQLGNVGVRINERLFLPNQGTLQEVLRLAHGRDLADATLGTGQASRRQLLLLNLALPANDNRGRLWLLAALNPEYLATQHELMLDSPQWRSAVLTLGGQILSATVNFPGELGAVLPGTPSPDAGEFGLWQRTDTDHETTLGAWRLTRHYPVRVQVETPMTQALAAWKSQAQAVATGTAALSAVLLGLGAAARRQRNARDQAERDKESTRAQLREHYEMTEQLVDAMAVPVFLTDLDGNLLLANAAWVRLMGLDREPPTAPETRERQVRVQSLLDRSLGEVGAGGRDEWPLDLPGAQGTPRETMVTKVALCGPAGQVRGVIGTVVDVTEYKQATRATESARRAAEASNQARAEFVANITHELRTPLQSILGFSELGMGRAEGQDKLKLMFQRVHRAGERMLRLVDELLDLSRIGSAVGTIKLRPTRLADTVREVVDELRPLASKRQIGLQLAVGDEIRDAECSIDPGRFQQVVRNVLANALRFAPADTDITVSVRAVEDQALVTVRDHGPGVPVAELEAIFEPFVQSSLTKDGSGGTGLGLAICRQIMTAHCGFIEALNHDDGGCLFRFGVPLPVTRADAPASTLAAALDESVSA